MAFEQSKEHIPIAQNPAEELEYLQKRIAQLQERIGVTDPTPEQKKQMAEKELAAYHHEDPKNVIHPSLEESKKDITSLSQKVVESSETPMDELLEMLVEKGVKNTLSVVEEIGSPFVTDDFHRHLVQYLSEGMDVKGLKEGTPLYKALHMTLFEVTLPHIDHEVSEFSRLVSAMEQFFEGMLSVESTSKMQKYFTIEVAISNDGEDIVFYVAVPNAKMSLFEKHLTSAFPRVSIEKVKGDYNPFNHDGVSVGSVSKLSHAAVLPLKIYDDFEQDPLNVLLGAFSKFQKVGEGASVQLVVSPVKNTINKEYKEVLTQVKKGTSLNRALEGAAMKIAREIYGIFADSKKEDITSPADADQSLVHAIEQKISSPIVETNIRIVGSAATKGRAENIVSDLESVFHQFANEPHNSIAFRRISPKGLQSFLHDYSFRLFNEKSAIRLNLKELSTILHFPVTESSVSDLKRSQVVTAPAPSEIQPGGVYLGKNVHQGTERDVYMSTEDRMRHMYVIGQTGTGKTTLLKNMIMQDINNGEGVCYIDPHGTDIEDILNNVPEHRKDDVIYFDPSDVSRPMGLNMLEYDPARPEQKAFVINEMLSIFNKLFDMKTAGGPMFEQYFRNATALVIDDPSTGNTLLDISRVLADARYRQQKLAACTNPIVIQFWKEIAQKAGGDASLQNVVPYITSKFDAFLSNDMMRSIVVQEKSSFNFRDVMDNRKILLVNLAKGRLGDINSHLIGLILVGKILMSALSRVDQSGPIKPADFYLYIDEFQNVTTDSISAILSEARKYRLGLIVAHQYIAQLDASIRDSVFGNVGSMATFRVGTEDAEYIQSQFAPTFTAHDIMRVPNHHAYVKMLVNGYPASPFSMQTQMPLIGHPEVGQMIKESSRQKYGKDKHVVDAAISEKYAQMQQAAEAARARMQSSKRPLQPPQQSVQRVRGTQVRDTDAQQISKSSTQTDGRGLEEKKRVEDVGQAVSPYSTKETAHGGKVQSPTPVNNPPQSEQWRKTAAPVHTDPFAEDTEEVQEADVQKETTQSQQHTPPIKNTTHQSKPDVSTRTDNNSGRSDDQVKKVPSVGESRSAAEQRSPNNENKDLSQGSTAEKDTGSDGQSSPSKDPYRELM